MRMDLLDSLEIVIQILVLSAPLLIRALRARRGKAAEGKEVPSPAASSEDLPAAETPPRWIRELFGVALDDDDDAEEAEEHHGVRNSDTMAAGLRVRSAVAHRSAVAALDEQRLEGAMFQEAGKQREAVASRWGGESMSRIVGDAMVLATLLAPCRAALRK